MNSSRDAVSFGVTQFALARVGIGGDKNDGINGSERWRRLCRNATSIVAELDEKHEGKQK